MLSDDIGHWAQEVESATQDVEDHLYSMREMIEATHGDHYVRGVRGQYMPENHYFSYTTLMTPRLIMDNPRFRCTTRRPGSQMDVAEAIRHGLNRWSKDTNLRGEGLKVAVDFQYNWGWMMIRQVPNRTSDKTEDRWIWDKDGTFRVKGRHLWPSAERLSQDAVFVDPQAFSIDQARYIGHSYGMDAEDLAAEAKAHPERGWDKVAIAASTAGGADSDPVTFDPLQIHDKRNEPARHRLKIYSIWCPEMQPDPKKGPKQGYHGAILTLGHKDGPGGGIKGSKWLRPPRAYYGPPEGPYVRFGAYVLPNKLWPLSPLVAIGSQIRELNRHARAWSRAAERHKRVVLYNEKDSRVAAKIRRAQHDLFVGIPGFDKTKFAEVEVGGATEAQYKAYAFLQDRLQRISAMDDAQMGNVTGAGTATENTIVSEVIATRTEGLKQQYRDSMCEVARRVAWYMYHDSRVVFPLGEEAADDMDAIEPWFYGGEQDPESDYTFDDLELEIEPYSLERTDQAGIFQRTMAGANFVIDTAQMIPMLPHVGWAELYDIVGDAMNWPRMAELVDVEAGLEQEPFAQGSRQAGPQLKLNVGNSSPWGGGGGRPTSNGAGSGAGADSSQGASVPGTRMPGLMSPAQGAS